LSAFEQCFFYFILQIADFECFPVWHRFGNFIGTNNFKKIKIKTMKTRFESNNSISQAFKNFWFALQLLIVSVSLPVMSFIQISHSGKIDNTKQQDKVISAPVNQTQEANAQQKSNTTNLKLLG
jgi:hypothetical protein